MNAKLAIVVSEGELQSLSWVITKSCSTI